MQPSFEAYDCFLSYRAEDHEAAAHLHQRLVAVGFCVWWDKAYLEAGMRWREEIQRHCEASRVILPLLTPARESSPWTRFEAIGAKFAIPLLLRGTREEVTPCTLAPRSELR